MVDSNMAELNAPDDTIVIMTVVIKMTITRVLGDAA